MPEKSGWIPSYPIRKNPYTTRCVDLGETTLGLVQMAMSPSPEENLENARRMIVEAARKGANIVCLPELYHVRYFPQHPGAHTAMLAETIPGRSTIFFSSLAREHNIVIVLPLYEKTGDGRFCNAAVVIDADGKVSEPYRKVHIPQDPGFYEKGYFSPGSAYRVFPTRYGRIGVLICFDQWFPEAARSVALEGADIIIYPTAIGHPGPEVPKEGGWQEAWELIQRGHAIANSVHVAAVNRVGTEGNCRFFGGSFVADAFGKVIARAGDGEEVIVVPVDFSMNAEVQDSWGFFRNRRPDTYSRLSTPFPGPDGTFPDLRPGDTPRNRGFHMPAEWEPHEAVWISWPHNTCTFPELSSVEQAYCEFIAHVHPSERIEVFVPTAVVHRKVRARLRETGVDMDRVTLHTTDYSDVWIRDYGPTFVVSPAQKKIAMVRWDFNAWGEKYEDQIHDGKIPAGINRRLNLPLFEPGIVMEGGSFDTNGQGTILTTRACLLNPNRNPSLSENEIEERLCEYLGVEKVIWLNRGIEGDDTDGHVDDVARFVGPSTVVCAYETDTTDVNYAPLKENFDILSRSGTEDGTPLTVIRLPMPAKVEDAEGQRYPASYTNFYIGNTVVIVPIFNDPNDAAALQILREIFPDRTVIGILARAMVEGFGTFHCATQQQPRL